MEMSLFMLNQSRGFIALPWASLLVRPAQQALAMRRFP